MQPQNEQNKLKGRSANQGKQALARATMSITYARLYSIVI